MIRYGILHPDGTLTDIMFDPPLVSLTEGQYAGCVIVEVTSLPAEAQPSLGWDATTGAAIPREPDRTAEKAAALKALLASLTEVDPKVDALLTSEEVAQRDALGAALGARR